MHRKDMNIKDDLGSGAWEWMYSEKEFEDGETFDVHFLFNKFTSDVKMIVTKRIEIVKDKQERIVREG